MVDLTEDSINLRALKKIDDSIREIIICAGQVAVYYYDINQNDWVRKNIEGTLFFVRRSNQPEYAFVVINRLNTINFVQKITKDLEISVQSPYLMYKNIEKDIYCIWFYDADQCVTLNENINQAMNLIKGTPSKLLLNGRSNTPKSKQAASSATPNHNNQNNNSQPQASEILKMLYNPASLGNCGDPILPPSDSMKPQLLMNHHSNENHIEPKCNDDLVKPIAQRRSVNLKELFESQLVLQESSIKENSQHCLVDNSDSQPNNKPQASTPSSSKPTPNKNEILIPSSTFMTDDLKKKSLTSIPLSNSAANAPSSNHAGLILLPDYPTESQPPPPPQNSTVNSDIVEAQQQMQMVPNIMPQQSIHPSQIPFPINFESGYHPLPPPSAPQMFTNSLVNCIPPNVFDIQQQHEHHQMMLKQQQQQPVTPIQTGRTSISKSDMYLSMEQLKKTLIYLLSNDADFLHAIHTAYVENIKK